eukprot:CAMPEP_0202960864 /NCGR_PEP_ID=MMETSP1396-20130829/5011_1 /ASSEMBLY_ACC=CAM_ASM_000872 /TAXON_ID= /ORGANISM="Pseudokeronopsis sp., Strain Brazil" /LENGTH=121 /DNA_ID=CAMNT_0049680367 /DNA_START=307 /DNA_END=672 /DNA_ORIENTATION=+
MPLKDYFENFDTHSVLAGEAYNYNENISTKIIVSLALYYKTLTNLGTEQHRVWRERCENAVDIGCFSLTELGHGSNARGIATTATYDKETKTFIINSPTNSAMKFWIGGAAETSNVTTIFA